MLLPADGQTGARVSPRMAVAAMREALAGAVIEGTTPGRTDTGQVTLFCSAGLAGTKGPSAGRPAAWLITGRYRKRPAGQSSGRLPLLAAPFMEELGGDPEG
jgi:hypothetical protein